MTGGLNDPALGGGNMRIGTAMLAPAIVPGTVAPPPADANPPRGPSTLERYLKEDLQFHTLESYRSLNLDINGVWNHEDRGETNSFIAAAMLYDFASRRSVSPVYLWGGLAIVVEQWARDALRATAVWQSLAAKILE